MTFSIVSRLNYNTKYTKKEEKAKKIIEGRF